METILEEYGPIFHYIKVTHNVVADALSRLELYLSLQKDIIYQANYRFPLNAGSKKHKRDKNSPSDDESLGRTLTQGQQQTAYWIENYPDDPDGLFAHPSLTHKIMALGWTLPL